MKHMRKLLAMVLAVMMVMSLATTAFAADNQGTIVNGTNRTYDAYWIFTGTQAEGTAVLGDIEWGRGINSTAFLNALKQLEVDNATPFAACTDAASVASVLKDCEDNSNIAKAFANLAVNYLTDAEFPVPANDTVTVNAGYYLLIDTTALSQNQTANPALLQVTNGSLEITEKTQGGPTPDKTILGEGDDAGEAATVSIGDIVTFQLKATMPSSLEGYDTYKLVFHDTLSAGLEFVALITEGANAPSRDDFTYVCDDGHTLTITFADLMVAGVAPNEEITITYTARVTDDAAVGSTGNTNEVYLQYSNDPNDETKTTTTPPDTVIVFTFELDVTKVDGQDATKKLSGAQFVLLNEAQNKVAVIEGGKIATWQDRPSGDAWITASILTSVDGKFAVEGLDQGTYYLKEIKAPAGYNLLTTPVKLVITATVTDTENTQSLDALTIKVGDHEAKAGDTSTGVVGATIENNAGTTLPETGGMGTTLFYVFGGIMMLGALVLLVTKKRMADAV